MLSDPNQTSVVIDTIQHACQTIKTMFKKSNIKTTVLYGGYLDQQNTATIFSLPAVDGLLLSNTSSNFQELKNMLDCLQGINKIAQKED
jgi:triosephosphate isomerase